MSLIARLQLLLCYTVIASAGLSLSSTTVAETTVTKTVVADETHTIAGMVMELRSGTPDVQVFLCHGKTGMPLTTDFQSFFETKGLEANGFEKRQENLAVVTTNEKGHFRFADVPEGTYRLVAVKWTGPYKGLFEKQGTVIQLLGTANEIKIPLPPEGRQQVVLRPSGVRILEFQQKTANNETLLVLSTKPPEFDPILGFDSLGDDFMTNIVGVHRMLLGKSTILNAPHSKLYGFFFAGDNSPGFAHVTIPEARSRHLAIPEVPFVAGWSDGKKTPDGKVAKLVETIQEHELSVSEILKIPPLSNDTYLAYRAHMKELRTRMSEKVMVREGLEVRIGDLLAAQAYLRLMKKK